jgi:hypothetical protein
MSPPPVASASTGHQQSRSAQRGKSAEQFVRDVLGHA